jgi:multicomponent Na+:H+ antiporter subunit D
MKEKDTYWLDDPRNVNRLYWGLVVVRGFFRPSPADRHGNPGNGGRLGIREAPLLCVMPPVVTALGCVALFFFADDVWNLLTGIL